MTGRWVLSVDLWGTLITYGDRDAEARWRIREFHTAITDFGYVRTPEQVEVSVRQARAETLDHQRTTGQQLPVREQVKQLLSGLGLADDEPLVDVLVIPHTHAVLRACPDVITGAHAALRQAKKRGAYLTLTSNTLATPAQVTQQILEGHHLSELLDDAVYSSALGIAKPRREVFEAVAARAGVPIEYVVHVGNDWRTDVLGALEAGCRAVWFNPRKRPSRPQAPDIWDLSQLAEAAADALGIPAVTPHAAAQGGGGNAHPAKETPP
ncbi:HAD family hydrolase (plasmid) [Streptosporangium sp. NBC_01495]|uniref:HAD family hydrolase n=1 Tax=Streptosporangium sp. NBC_01495 TaxID=2903899 RepID=UPI002E35DEBB|nr:HAD family hydrolase [Streptosporangium sp. NBC_01495]